MINNQSIPVHAISKCMLTSLSADEILLAMNVNWSTNFSGLPLELDTTVWMHYLDAIEILGKKARRELHENVMKPRSNNPTEQLLYGHLHSISQTIGVRRTIYVGHSGCVRTNS